MLSSLGIPRFCKDLGAILLRGKELTTLLGNVVGIGVAGGDRGAANLPLLL